MIPFLYETLEKTSVIYCDKKQISSFLKQGGRDQGETLKRNTRKHLWMMGMFFLLVAMVVA